MLEPIAMTAGAALGTYWLPALAPLVPPLRSLLRIPDRFTNSDDVVLTFDDGPHPEGTPAALAQLASARAAAIFFLVGEQVERRPELAAEIAAAGHEIALHCHRHRNPLRLTPPQMRDDLDRAVTAIGEATGRETRLYRPPYGIFTTANLLAARQRRWQPLLWSKWGRDWEASATPASIAARLTHHPQAGDVLLLHDADYYSAAGSWRRTTAAIPRVLEALHRHGLRPAPIACTQVGQADPR